VQTIFSGSKERAVYAFRPVLELRTIFDFHLARMQRGIGFIECLQQYFS